MNDRCDAPDGRNQGEQSRSQGGGGRGGGPGPDTRFLQLEMSEVLFGDAQSAARQALSELLREAAEKKLRERFGDRIDALAGLAVDALLGDMEASLAVEGSIAARQTSHAELRRKAAELFRK